MTLPEALEAAAGKMTSQADAIRSANGDPHGLLDSLTPKAAAKVLRWLLENAEDAADELAVAWSEVENGARVIQSVDQAELPKAGRKVLRRTLHRLRGRGLEVAAEATTPVVARITTVEEDVSLALLSAIDPSGARAVTVVEANPSGGARLFELIVDDGRGVLECEVFSTSRGKARRYVKEIADRERFPAISAPPESVHALLARVVAHQLPNRPAPRSFGEWRARLTTAETGTRTPGELARDALGIDGDAEQTNRVVELVRNQELGPWPPERDRLAETAATLEKALEARIVVSGARRAEQVDEALAEAGRAIFDSAHAAVTRTRLEEMAYVWWKTDREADARACLAAAAGFEDDSAGEHPMAKAILEVLLAPLLQKHAQEEEPPILVKP